MPPEEQGGRRAAHFTPETLIAVATVASVLVAAGFAAAALIRSAASEGEPEPFHTREVHALRTDVRVEADGDVHVTERITYEFTGAASPVIRRLPHTAIIENYLVTGGQRDASETSEWDQGLRDVRVVDDGGVRSLKVAEEDGQTEVRVADPEAELTGTRSFTIEYTYRDLLVRDADGRPRLFLDVVRADWLVPVRDVGVGVALPGAPENAVCRAGKYRSGEPCTSEETSGGEVEFTQRGAALDEAVRIDIALGPDDVDPPPPRLVEPASGWGSALFLGLLVLGFAAAVRRSARRAPDDPYGRRNREDGGGGGGPQPGWDDGGGDGGD